MSGSGTGDWAGRAGAVTLVSVGDGTAVVNLFGDSLLAQRYSTTCFDQSQGKPFLTGHHTNHSPPSLEASKLMCMFMLSHMKLTLETKLCYILLLLLKSTDSVKLLLLWRSRSAESDVLSNALGSAP